MWKSRIKFGENSLIYEDYPEETVKNFSNYFPNNNIEKISQNLKIKQKNMFYNNLFINKLTSNHKRIKIMFVFKNTVNRIIRSFKNIKELKSLKEKIKNKFSSKNKDQNYRIVQANQNKKKSKRFNSETEIQPKSKTNVPIQIIKIRTSLNE